LRKGEGGTQEIALKEGGSKGGVSIGSEMGGKNSKNGQLVRGRTANREKDGDPCEQETKEGTMVREKRGVEEN